MPGFQVRTDVHTSGPLADGRARRAAAAYTDDIRYAVALRAEELVQARLVQVLQHPTGYYQSRISLDRRGTSYIVHDGMVVYGPWLEGTGSRNFPVTRFRGYATFRRTKALVDRQADGIAQRLLARYKARGAW